jgi:hypothetical protein
MRSGRLLKRIVDDKGLLMNKNKNSSQLFIYQTEDGRIKIDVRFQDETVWLTQQLMADLFQTTKQNISLHVRNIYEEGELNPESTVKESLTVQTEGHYQYQGIQKDFGWIPCYFCV